VTLPSVGTALTPGDRGGDAAAMSRHAIRIGGAVAATVMALIYFGIGLGALQVVDPATQRDSLLPFGALAGGAFLLGAVLLVLTDRQVLWILGALFQVFVAIMYVVVSQSRTPPFELWGVTLRVIQVPLFLALVVLALRRPEALRGPEARPVRLPPFRG
jgi:peptidoglycan/LPS O-acetylase OafA/YrhL